MSESAVPRHPHQERVDTHFQAWSSYWRDIYTSEGLRAVMFRDRHAAVLQWIDELALPAHSRVLEVGCGAGLMAVDLCRRRFRVDAVDSSEAMVEMTRQHAAEAGITDLLSTAIGDINSLAFEDASFDLVLAIGVIPWVERPESALQEMARVTRPNRYVIVTASNRLQLNHLLDPWNSPVLRPLKLRVKDAIEQIGIRRPSPNMTYHSPRFIDHALARAGVVKMRSMTVGFGPFSLLDHAVLPERLAVAVHRRLQRLADQGAPVIRSMGKSYHVLARKPVSHSLKRATKASSRVR